jgi:hypothetical protein
MRLFRSFLPLSAAASRGAEPAPDTTDAPARPAKDAIVDLLKLEGCQPTVDDDGDIVFRHHNITYVLIFSKKDPEFIRLLLPNFLRVESDTDRRAAFEAANLTNRLCKAAKIYLERNQAQAAIEYFLASHQHIVSVLLRSAHALEHAAKFFGAAYSIQRGS